MYGYNNYISNISVSDILNKYNQKAIFEKVFGHSINLDEKYISPFRDDKTPNCYFEQYNNIILFVDFAEIGHKRSRTCVKAIADRFFNSDINKAVQYIANNFDNSFENNISPTTTIKEDKPQFKIFYTKQDYTKKDLLFWSKFLITKKDLIEDNVYSVKNFYTISSKGKFSYINMGLCFAIDFIDAVKLYQPYRLTTKGKWITNCNENHIGNFDNLPHKGSYVIITKSYKDHRVLKNLGYTNTIWLQNESCIPDNYILENLLTRFSKIFILYDNDNTGYRVSYTLKNVFDSIKADKTNCIFLPKKREHKELYGKYLKDCGEYINKEGKEYLIKTLKKIGLNGKNTTSGT